MKLFIRVIKEIEKIEETEEIDMEEREKREKIYRDLNGYKWKEEIVNYGGIKQIWLIVESQKRKNSDLEKLDKKLKKEKGKVEKLLKDLKKEDFETPEQARYKLKGINKHLKLFEIQEVQLTESKSKDNKTKDTQYKGAYNLFLSLVNQRTINNTDVENSIIALEKLGFNTLPFSVSFDDVL